MPYYEDEILKKLVLGEKYTERQLRIFIENVNDIVISKSCKEFNMNSNSEHKLIEIIEGYIHRGSNLNGYNVPNSAKRIYIVD